MTFRINGLASATLATLFAATLFTATSGTAYATGYPIGQPNRVDGGFSCRNFDTANLLTEMTVTPVDGGAQVTVIAETLLRDLSLLADRVHPDAVVDDMLATLLPGEAVTWTVRGAVDPDRLLAADVLRSANQLVRPADR